MACDSALARGAEESVCRYVRTACSLGLAKQKGCTAR